jgi:acyl-CoA dehydrogenase
MDALNLPRPAWITEDLVLLEDQARMDEYPISRLYRGARVMRIYAGTNEIMNLLIARGL